MLGGYPGFALLFRIGSVKHALTLRALTFTSPGLTGFITCKATRLELQEEAIKWYRQLVLLVKERSGIRIQLHNVTIDVKDR